MRRLIFRHPFSLLANNVADFLNLNDLHISTNNLCESLVLHSLARPLTPPPTCPSCCALDFFASLFFWFLVSGLLGSDVIESKDNITLILV